MTIKIISGILILITVYLNFKHGWSGIRGSMSPEEVKMMADLGMGKTQVLVLSILCFAVCILTLIPQTFFAGNLLNIFIIVTIMALALRGNNYKIALIEIPFLLMPMIMIYLGHPFKK